MSSKSFFFKCMECVWTIEICAFNLFKPILERIDFDVLTILMSSKSFCFYNAWNVFEPSRFVLLTCLNLFWNELILMFWQFKCRANHFVLKCMECVWTIEICAFNLFKPILERIDFDVLTILMSSKSFCLKMHGMCLNHRYLCF